MTTVNRTIMCYKCNLQMYRITKKFWIPFRDYAVSFTTEVYGCSCGDHKFTVKQQEDYDYKFMETYANAAHISDMEDDRQLEYDLERASNVGASVTDYDGNLPGSPLYSNEK